MDCGRYPAKRTAGDTVVVSADISREAGVRWAGSFDVDTPGRWTFTIEAWTDAFASWRDELERKVAAAQDDLSGELSEGVLLLERVCGLAEGDDRVTLERALSVVRDTSAPQRTRAADHT